MRSAKLGNHLKRHEHFCQVTPVFEPKEESPTSQSPTQRPLPPSHASHSASIQVDPHRILPEVVRANFQSLLSEYDSVFDPHFPGYNGSTGPYQAKVNMGPVEPPQWNGRLPQYARDKLVELQEKFDHLEQLGVFQRREDFTLGIKGFSRVRRSRERNLWHGAVLFTVPIDLWAFLSDYIYANQIESLQLWSCGWARKEVSKDPHYPQQNKFEFKIHCFKSNHDWVTSQFSIVDVASV